MRIPRKRLPPGVVRELQTFEIDGPDAWRWDFAWRDPATGRVVQYSACAHALPGMADAAFHEMVREPALACIEREIHRKCGMEYAIKNQYPLSLPGTCIGRFV